MPSGLSFLVEEQQQMHPSRHRFSLFSGAHNSTLVSSTFLPLWFLLVTFCVFFFFFCQSSYVVFLIPLYLPHNFPTMFPHTTFFFFSREEQQSFYLKFNDVTPSTNFLVCSKCVIGDSQQDRNARACFLVKQKKNKKTATE